MALYLLWLVTTALALTGAWGVLIYLRRREAYHQSVLAILRAPLEIDDFAGQAQMLCEACTREAGASGCSLYLQPGEQESGFRRAAQAGRPAEETGPGVVRDLLNQAWDTGQSVESNYGGRWLVAVPVWPGHLGGGALLVTWESSRPPGNVERGLLDAAATVASLLAPRFAREGALARAHEELQALHVEIAEESHLAGVGRLAAGVAHELNTPLGAVLTMVGSLSRTVQDPSSARRLQIMRDAVEKCKAIIEKLLVYSRGPIETERGLTFSRFVRASTDLNRTIESCVELMRENLSEAGISVSLDLAEIPEFRANTTQWSHVFNNLLVNARDALRSAQVDDPQIQVRTRSDRERIQIEFSDNGPGIPPEVIPHIFEPFFTTKDIGHGTGLGLAIVREVVRKHQGAIQVKSEPGAGASFVIQLPLQQDFESSPAARPEAKA